MDTALAASALLMGLTGSLHCASMCGPAFGAIAATRGSVALSGATVSLHVGRLLSYAAAGALVASTVSALGTLETAGPLLRPIWTMVQVAAVALGLSLAWRARVPQWLTRAGRPVAGLTNARVIRVFRHLPRSGRAGLAGACWAGMPCGLLQSALVVAALASGPIEGAAVMSTFAVASGLGLWAGPNLWSRLHAAPGGERWSQGSVRLAGALLAASSLFALWHGLGATIAQICASPI